MTVEEEKTALPVQVWGRMRSRDQEIFSDGTSLPSQFFHRKSDVLDGM